jgi:glutamine---fructose-6-phosphate transaminase (isomerizing)
MCGIIGYVGPKEAAAICLLGLEKLEYRGYDSAGLAGILEGKISACRAVGKLAALKKQVQEGKFSLDRAAIGHTRWATHGRPTMLNAHPHTDQTHQVAVVHNGIIENHEELRQELIEAGVHFNSETDTEVIAQLIGSLYEGDLLSAVQRAVPRLQGALAIAVVHADHPDEIIVSARESPLVIGVGNGECFVASDTHAFLVHTREVCYLAKSEVARVRADGFQVYDETASEVVKQTQRLQAGATDVSKGAYQHYMLKEIFEQPQTTRNALLSRLLENNAIFDLDIDLREVRKVLLIGCGTAYHAALGAAYTLESWARVPVQVEIASELRYKNPVIERGTLAVAVSQSGETADTLAAVREVRAKGAPVIAICNVQESTLTREADATLFLHAGPEIGVASTKAYTSQQVVLSLLSLLLGRMRHLGPEQGLEIVEALKNLPSQLQQILDSHEEIWRLGKRYSDAENFFFLGRRYMYPAALEGALKLKEISYVNANGYPGGEMKHGPIALIDESSVVIGCCADNVLVDKMLSNLQEIQARGGRIMALAFEGTKGFSKLTDDVIWLPRTLDPLAPILVGAALQLFDYDIARVRGAEIDQPRNLAKSVTVE